MSGRTDRASKIIHAPASAIYRALISPDALVQWLAPKGMTGTIDKFDLRQEAAIA